MSKLDVSKMGLSALRQQLSRQKINNDGHMAKLKARMELCQAKNKGPMFAGNVEDINKLMWLNYFSTDVTFIEPDQVKSGNINISLEGPFVAKYMTRTVYEYEDLGGGNFNLTYIDPRDKSATGILDGLKYQIIDSQSTRSWTEDPISIDSMGYAEEPTKFEDPFLLPAKSNLEIRFNNNSAKTYMVSVSLMGYRFRMQDAQKLLGVVVSG